MCCATIIDTPGSICPGRLPGLRAGRAPVGNCSGFTRLSCDRSLTLNIADSSSGTRALLHAFLNTDYEVWVGGRWRRMRIGARPTLPAHASPGSEWCIITAFNPDARPHDRAANLRASARLRLALAGRALLRSRNRDPSGEWPDEPGWLFGRCRDDEVHALARRFGQRAVVCGTDHDNRLELWFYGTPCMDNLSPMIRPYVKVLDA